MKKTMEWPSVNKSQVKLLHARETLEKVEMLDLSVETLGPIIRKHPHRIITFSNAWKYNDKLIETLALY